MSQLPLDGEMKSVESIEIQRFNTAMRVTDDFVEAKVRNIQDLFCFYAKKAEETRIYFGIF